MKSLPVVLLLCLAACCSSKAKSEEIRSWKVIRDSKKQLSINQVLTTELPFTVEKSSLFNFGFTSDAIWITSSINEPTGGAILMDNPLIRYIDFYLIASGRIVSEKHIEYLRDRTTGVVESTVLTFDIPRDFHGQVVMRFISDESLVIPIEIIETGQTAKIISGKIILGYVITGSILALILLYFIFFISLRDRVYFFYWFYAITVLLTVLRTNGILYYWFPSVKLLNNHTSFFETLPAISAGIFTIYFLQLKTFMPTMYRVVWAMVGLQISSLFISLAGFNQFAFLFTDLVAFAFIPIAVTLGYRMWINQNYSPAKYYLISWIFLFTGAMLFLTRNYGIWQSSMSLANHTIDLGIAFEMILLAVGLSKRVEQLRKDKETLQQHNIDILSRQKSELERMVAERTYDLEAQNEEIIQQQQQIEAMNKSLEGTVAERTAQLEIQNKTLLEYAYFNAHKVRGPLARILGLTYLMKRGDTDGGSEMIERIDVCAKELDSVIKEVNLSLTKNHDGQPNNESE